MLKIIPTKKYKEKYKHIVNEYNILHNMDENNTIVIDIYDTDENIQQTAKIINQYSNI